MKKFAIIAVLALCVMGFFACGKDDSTTTSGSSTSKSSGNTSAAKDEVVTVEFWHGYSTGMIHEKMNEVVAYFESQNPNIKINQTLVPWGEITTKALTATTAGNPPDIFRGWSWVVVDWGNQNALTPLNDLIASDPNFDIDDFYPSVVETSKVNGKIVAISPSFSVRQIIFANDDLLKEAGYDTIPTDFYEFKKMCEDIDSKADPANGKPYAFMPWNIFNNLEGWVYGLCGKTLYDYDNKIINIKHDPEVYQAAVEVITWYQEIAERIGVDYAMANCFPAGGKEEIAQRKSTVNPFYMGEVAMWHAGLFNIADLEEFAPQLNYSMHYLPGVTNPDSSLTESNFYFMPKGAKNKEAAWEFLKFLGGEYFMENFVIYDTVIPARESVANSEAYADSPIVPLLDSLDKCGPPLKVMGQSELGKTLANSTLDMFSGRITPEDVVNQYIEVLELNVGHE